MLRTNVVLTLLVIFSFSVSAQNRTYNIYIDKDNKSTTGCSVVQPDFATQFDGIDGYISVTTSASPVVINSSLYHECVGGVFDGGSAVVSSALGLNTANNGDDVFEFQIGTSDLGIRSSSTAKLYFSVESDISSDIVTVNNSGNGIFANVAFPIPTLSTISLLFLCLIVFIVAKKAYKNKALILASVMLFSTMVWGMFLFVIDGEVNDWSSFNPINDPIGDNSAPANFSDITKVFAILEQDFFTARMDVVDVENQAPTIISANTASVLENQTSAIDVESTDVNGDVEGGGLTYALTGAIDDSLFSIDVNFGVVTFLVAPDFEAPSDSGADNNYDIQVTVTDSGGLTDVQDIVVTVTNDINDDASVEFQSASSSSTDEATVLNIVVELTALAPLTAPLSVDVVDAGGGSALSGTDYTAIGTQTITFPIGAIGGAVLNATLTPNNDANVEGDETVNLLMQNVSGPGTLGVQTNHTATITDDDFAQVSFQLASSATVNEATPLDMDVVINIPGGGQLDSAVNVDVVDAGGGSATSGVDYNVFGVQTLTFPIGTTNGTSQSATLTPIDDPNDEGNETVNLALQNLVANSSVSLGVQTTHTATITDDEATVEFSLASSATVNEAVALDVGVVLTTPIPLTAPLSVDVVDAGTGSATSVVDYISFGTQTLTFPIGSTNGTTLNASLVPINDNNVENNESVNLQLQNLVGTGSIGAQSSHVVTITEDDAASVSFFAATSATVDESTPLNIGVQLTIPVGGQLEIPLSIDVVDAGGGSATSTTDYSAIGTQTFTFSFGAVNGNTLNAVLIPIDDPDTEGDETVNLLLQNLNGPVLSSIGAQPTHTATITDDDNLPPVAVNDAYDSIGNVGITVPAVSGLISNDSDPNADPLTVTAGTFATTQGGTITIAVDGSFDYTPPIGYTGSDTYLYTLHDSNMTTDTATVTITVFNKIWFINGDVAASGNGSLNSAFKNTSDFESAGSDGAGDCIFVYRASGFNYSSVITLLNNQKLIGEGSTTGLAAECAITVPPFSKTLPITGGTKPVLIGVTGVNVASGNTIRGFEIVNAHQKIVGSNFGTLKVRDVDLVLNGEAINLQNGTADIILDSVQANGSSGYGIRLVGVSGVFTVTGGTSINTPTLAGIFIENSNLNYTFGTVQVIGRLQAGIQINAFTGGVQTGVFGDVTIINSGAANNTTGFAIDNIVTAGSTITIANVSIDNQLSNSAGMALSNNDGATINVNGGSVNNSNGPNVSISSGSGNVNIAASINSLSGRSLQVLNNDGGTITLSGTIVGASASSTGIFINNNTGATINLSGQLTLSTAANDAFTATGGGTLNVTGSGNSIVTTTATAVNLSNINIGTSNVTFERVESNGGNRGIILSLLGGTGSFNITGIGTTNNSGGIIQNKSLNGIVVQNSSNINLSNMSFVNATNESPGCFADVGGVIDPGENCNAAIELESVSNIVLNNVLVDGNGDTSDELGIYGLNVTNFDMNGVTVQNTSDEVNEHGIYIINLLGTGANSSHWQNLVVDNTVGDTAILIAQRTTIAGELLIDGASEIKNAFEGGFEARTLVGNADLTVTLGSAVGGSFTIENTNIGAAFFAERGSLTSTVRNATIYQGVGIASINRPGSGTNGVMFVGVTGQSNLINSDVMLSINSNIMIQEDGGAGGTGREVTALGGSFIINGLVSSNIISSDDEYVDGVFTNFTGDGAVSTNQISITNNSMNMSGSGANQTIAGIEMNASNSFGGLYANVQGNTISYAGANTFSAGMVFVAGANSVGPHNNTFCTNVLGNDVDNTNPGSFGHYGFVQFGAAVKNIEGAGIGVVTDAQVDAYITANDLDAGIITTGADVDANNGTMNGVNSCL